MEPDGGSVARSQIIVCHMPQLDPRVSRTLACVFTGAMLLVSAGCGRDRQNRQTASVDSALARDLTLAASAASTVAIGDTAVATTPSAPTPRTPAARPTPQAPTAATTPRPAPSRAGRPASSASSATTTRPPQPVSPEPAPAATASASVPATTPQEPATAAAPAAGESSGRRRGIGAGAILAGATGAEICTLANRPGDRFVVSLAQAVSGPDGALLPAGTPVLVELAQPGPNGEFAFRLKGVQLNGEFIPAEGGVQVADATIAERSVSKGGDKGKVITGAVAGAILGRILGGSTKGAVIGAAGGAAAGTVAAARNTTKERCLPAGTTLSATLSSTLLLPDHTP